MFRSLTAETYLRSLNFPNVESISSGTNVDFTIPQERVYFGNTLELLSRHGIRQFAKDEPNLLTQERIDASDVVVIVNQRAFDEAQKLVELPKNTIMWSIVDIGEGDRIATDDNRIELEELIYEELTATVDDLIASLHLRS